MGFSCGRILIYQAGYADSAANALYAAKMQMNKRRRDDLKTSQHSCEGNMLANIRSDDECCSDPQRILCRFGDSFCLITGSFHLSLQLAKALAIITLRHTFFGLNRKPTFSRTSVFALGYGLPLKYLASSVSTYSLPILPMCSTNTPFSSNTLHSP